jgi:PDZ domain-containing protein
VIEDFEPAPFDPERFEAGSYRRRRRPAGWLAFIPVAALVIIMSLVPMPFYMLSPGDAEDVVPLIHVDGHPTFDTGHLLLTDVLFLHVNAYQAAWGWLHRPSRQLLPESYFLAPGQTDEQQQVVAFNQMDTSKIDAAVVALTAYEGYPKNSAPGVLVECEGTGCFDLPQDRTYPADGKLGPGDLIQAVDGTAVRGPAQLGKMITAAGAGHPLRFTVKGDQGVRTETIAAQNVQGVDHPIIGIGPVNNFPFPITISSGQIGGPSAGLMWTLGLIDLLTAGDLTGGRVIAGTGMIGPGGTVFPIGGVQQKVVAAEQAGAVVFFCPQANVADARSVAERITIVPVATFADAVAYLNGPAPTTLPTPTPAPTSTQASAPPTETPSQTP